MRDKKYRQTVLILFCIVCVETALLAFLWFSRPRLPRPAPAARAEIAIVIDDWGYNLNNLRILNSVKLPLTVSILPNLSYSKTIAEVAHAHGFRVILHLPMEPYEKARLEKNGYPFHELLLKALGNFPCL